MAKTYQGMLMSAVVEKVDVFQWTDPANGQIKPIRSLKALLAHGDGTVERVSISLPSNMDAPPLDSGKAYTLPVTVSFNKKRQSVSYTLRTDVPPLPALQIG